MPWEPYLELTNLNVESQISNIKDGPYLEMWTEVDDYSYTGPISRDHYIFLPLEEVIVLRDHLTKVIDKRIGK